MRGEGAFLSEGAALSEDASLSEKVPYQMTAGNELTKRPQEAPPPNEQSDSKKQ